MAAVIVIVVVVGGGGQRGNAEDTGHDRGQRSHAVHELSRFGVGQRLDADFKADLPLDTLPPSRGR